MRYLLAMCPILLVLGLMIWRKWGAHKAGLAGWLAALAIGALAFGATPQLFWVSQAKGLLLSIFVLGVMWPALLLYHWVDRNGGIEAVARLLERAIAERGICLVLLAWALSGMLEGLAGFGLPIAVVAPMLVALRVPAIKAVAAVAVGHSWAVTFGDMGVILQTLSAVVALPVEDLVPWAGLLLGAACLVCGLMAALILGEGRQWPRIVALSVVMGLSQYGLATAGLVPLSAFGAGLAGLAAYLAWSKLRGSVRLLPAAGAQESVPGSGDFRATKLTIACYGGLTLLMSMLTMIPVLRTQAGAVRWSATFPGVDTTQGFRTGPGPGQVFRPLSHPGTLTLAVALASMAVAGRKGVPRAKAAALATARSAGLASVGIVFMVGLSTLMDHCGMSHLLARGLSVALGAAYPLLSPCVGILGAFATGSNNNSNVLFGSLQKNVAVMLDLNPSLMSAAQTAGGSMGSMLAPAKIVVGCSTVRQAGREGAVLRQTVPCGLAAGLLLGVLAFFLTRLR